MIPIVEVAKGIFRIGPLETGRVSPATSPFLVMGERVAIVEPGEDGQSAQLLEGIKEIGVALDRIDYLIASHIHLHHVQGVNLLLRVMPNARVVVHRRGVPHLVEPTRLNASTLQVWGETSGCPQIDPVPEGRIWGVSGGEVLDLGGRELEIIETTGHAPHHISIFDRLTRALFPGDAAGFFALPGRERARPDILPPLFEMEIAADSLHRLRALKPSVLFLFGYGGTSHSPDKSMQWAEEDFRAVGRICLEGMKKKLSNQEIGRQVNEYYDSVDIAYGAEATGGGGGGRGGSMAGPIGMYAYLKRQDPSLEMPKGSGGDRRGVG